MKATIPIFELQRKLFIPQKLNQHSQSINRKLQSRLPRDSELNATGLLDPVAEVTHISIHRWIACATGTKHEGGGPSQLPASTHTAHERATTVPLTSTATALLHTNVIATHVAHVLTALGVGDDRDLKLLEIREYRLPHTCP